MLGVDGVNKGTSELKSRWAPERAAMIAGAKRGKPRPRHLIEAARTPNTLFRVFPGMTAIQKTRDTFIAPGMKL
jgi:hypothetical protein